jgi:hypothetical protein
VSWPGDDYRDGRGAEEIPDAGAAVSQPDGFADGAADAVTRFLLELRDLASVPAPVPCAELAAAFAGVAPLRVLAPTTARRRALVLGAVAAATTSLTGVAAAANVLPAPAQRLVSRVVHDITPFQFGPGGPHPPAVVPAATTTRPPESETPGDGAGSSERRTEPADSGPGTSGPGEVEEPGTTPGRAGGAGGEGEIGDAPAAPTSGENNTGRSGSGGEGGDGPSAMPSPSPTRTWTGEGGGDLPSGGAAATSSAHDN